ncbi:MAG TPA: STAS domain-containing protein [Terriglobales bacterium]|nr:STAS domain-containing protein [Terriglobales bacterium]
MFNLNKQTLGATTIVHCSGRIVFPYAESLPEAMPRLSRTRKLVLDLANVIAIDAAGLGALVSLHHWAKKTRTEFKLMNVSTKLQFLLEITRLDEVLDVCSAREMLRLLHCSVEEEEPNAFEIRFDNGKRPEQESVVGG